MKSAIACALVALSAILLFPSGRCASACTAPHDMKPPDVDTLIAGIIGWMREENVAPTRTRLMKFLYLADLHYARHHEGKTATGWRWYVNAFGPMANEAYSAFEAGVAAGWLRESGGGPDSNGEQGGAIFYDANVKPANDTLLAVGKVRQWIKKYGDDTNRLLRFVYGSTEPMLDAHEGDLLDFSDARPIDSKPIELLKSTRNQEKKFVAAMKALRAEYEAARAANAKIVDGPYDDVYRAGVPDETSELGGVATLVFGKRS